MFTPLKGNEIHVLICTIQVLELRITWSINYAFCFNVKLKWLQIRLNLELGCVMQENFILIKLVTNGMYTVKYLIYTSKDEFH